MASDTELWRGTDYGWWLAADTSGAVGASLIAFAVPLMMLSMFPVPSPLPHAGATHWTA